MRSVSAPEYSTLLWNGSSKASVEPSIETTKRHGLMGHGQTHYFDSYLYQTRGFSTYVEPTPGQYQKIPTPSPGFFAENVSAVQYPRYIRGTVCFRPTYTSPSFSSVLPRPPPLCRVQPLHHHISPMDHDRLYRHSTVSSS